MYTMYYAKILTSKGFTFYKKFLESKNLLINVNNPQREKESNAVCVQM